MKKTYIFILALVLAVLCGQTALAGECTAVSCIPSAPDADGVCEVSVELENGEGLAMVQFALRYDAEKLECLSVEGGELLTGNEEPTLNTEIPGKVYFVWDSLEPLTADGALMSLKMRLKGAETAELSFDFEEEFIFAKEDFTEIELYSNGCVVGETPEETVEIVESAEPETAERDAFPLWIAVGAGAVLVLAGAAVLFWKRMPRGRH